MSNTKIDFAKVTQLLDAGWTAKVFKNGLGSYTATAKNVAGRSECTDDFTVEQALTRLAYKAIDGEILWP